MGRNRVEEKEGRMRTKSKKYVGVYQESLADGDVSYYFTYKDLEKKKKWIKVGLHSEDVREKDAHERRLDTLNHLRLGEIPNFIRKRTQENKITVDEVAEKYFKYLYNKDKTIGKRNQKESLGIYKTRLSPAFGGVAVEDLSKAHIQDFLDRLKDEDLADATVNNYHSIIKAILNYGIANFEKLESLANVASKIPLLKLDNARQRILSISEMIEALELLSHKPKAYLFFGLLMQTGARPAAILSLKKIHVNLSGGTLTIKGLKKGMSYQVTVSGQILDMLETKLQTLESNHYVFHPDKPVTDPTKQIVYESMRRQIQPSLEKRFNSELESHNRIDRVTFYTLRHSFATHLAQNPHINVFDLKNLMGHSSLKMTERYAKAVLQEGTKNAVINLYAQT
jgi:integrase